MAENDSVKRLTKQERDLQWEAFKAQKLEEFTIAKNKLLEDGLLDDDGYPTEACLNVIETWFDPDFSEKRVVDWFDFINSAWYLKSFGWHSEEDVNEYDKEQKIRRFYLSTAGWSGNESIIAAMKRNIFFWEDCWVQSRRGGHFIFEVKLPLEES